MIDDYVGMSERLLSDPRAERALVRDWDQADTAAYRREFERRFRERTPARRIDEVDFGTRVSRSEMRNWCLNALGKKMPELDREWWLEHVRWARKLMKKIVKEQDPGDYQRLIQHWQGEMPLPKE